MEYTGVSEEFMYFGSDLSSTRLPKATTSPRVSITGSISRFRNLSYSPPFRFFTTSPASNSSDLVYPFLSMAVSSVSQASGEAPMPNRTAVAFRICRLFRYALTASPSGCCSS